ncbi:methyltransferase [Hyphomicrobium sp.]|uniref:methyltransferase n=1 Tax=Hyphomicrobium sp. TaxID=82 RepID=UPI0025BA0F70|nr:methyltransferase [Hyphomicrobium sp.]MCC7253483.1 ubiquinone/menaquinone biosynthesis protein [Hyphomicrobium sp.]
MDEAAAATRLMEMAIAHWAGELLFQAARMNLADKFSGDEPRSAADLAAEYGMRHREFYRYLRSLTGLGLLASAGGDSFRLTDLGAALKEGATGSTRSAVMALLGDMVKPAWKEFEHGLLTGDPGFEKAHGMGLFAYLQNNPGMAQFFSETMVGFHGREPPAVAEAYDFSGIGSLVDVGGASGNMLGHVLSRYPDVKGVLYDLPHVVPDAPQLLAAHGVADRVTIESGSFFERVPAGHDAYLLSHIIHDWDDGENATILRNVREAMKPDGKLLIVEMVLPESDEPHMGKMLDMMMLLVPGGEERTPSEYAALLEPNGFRVARVVPTASAVSVVEAVRA